MCRKILTITLYSLINSLYAQNGESIHILINKHSNEIEIIKGRDSNKINFYIREQHFEAEINDKNPTVIDKVDLEKIPFIKFDCFFRKVNLEVKRNIEEGEKIGAIKILSNSEFFEEIFFYQETDEAIFRYKVIWTDSILD